MGIPVSAFILAYNSEDRIARAVKSVLWADEVVVIDSFSEDRTAEISEELGAKVVQVKFEGFGKLRLAGIEHTSHDWIFSLDSDEECTPEAEKEIREIINSDNSAEAYHTPRRNFFMGQPIRFSGWYPDYRQPQLFQRGKMTYSAEELVHEGYCLDGRLGYMKCDIIQVPFASLSEVMEKCNRYSTLGAEELIRVNRRGSIPQAIVHGVAHFIQVYFFKLGVLDGGPGFMIAWCKALGSYFKYAKLSELNRKTASG
ncbi:MAG: glycosyltransferase family 2 protein [Verrucomicrobiota bacterium]|nr:glycosyltransferase family 2 protein [Verrucomicrobiota bacterium]